MSLKALFGSKAQRLLTHDWSKMRSGYGVQALAEEIVALFNDSSPIKAYEPFVIENYSVGPGISIRDQGGSSRGYEFIGGHGEVTCVGTGLQNCGLVASDLLPQPTYFVCRAEAHDELSTTGGVAEADTDTLPADGTRVARLSRQDRYRTGYVLSTGDELRCEGAGTGIPRSFHGGEFVVAGSAGQFFHEIQCAMTAGETDDAGTSPWLIPPSLGGTGGTTTTTGFNNLAPGTTLGDIIVHNGTNNVRLPVGVDGQALVADSAEDEGVKWGTPTVVGAHTLLGAAHSDTVTAAVTRGSIIVGNATPAWDELVIGAANRVLRSDGTDAAWGQVVLTTDVSGTLPIANGGTGQTTQTAAFDALAPTTTKGDIIVSNGTDNVRLAAGTDGHALVAASGETEGVEWAAVGDVTGPGSSTDNAIPRFDGTGGKTLQDSGLTIDDNDKLKTLAQYSDINTESDGATITFDLNASNVHAVTLGGNRTLALSNESVGQKFVVRLEQDSPGGSRTVTWWSTIKWAGGAAPTLTTTAGKADLFGFLVTSAGNYDGVVIGLNI